MVEDMRGMKRYFVKKAVAGGLAMLLLLGFAAVNLRLQAPALLDALGNRPVSEFLQAPEVIDSTLAEGLFLRVQLTDLYGIAARELRKAEVCDFAVVADSQGFLHQVSLNLRPLATESFVGRIAGLADRLEKQQIPLTFILTPDRYLRGFTELPEGLPEPVVNQAADELLTGLAQRKVNTVDLRALLAQGLAAAPSAGTPPASATGLTEGLAPFVEATTALSSSEQAALMPSYAEVFYHSDESWTNEAAFWAARLIAEDLATNPRSNMTAPALLQISRDSFESRYYASAFAGSFTQTIGESYGALDNYTWLYPRDVAQLSYTRTDGLTETRVQGSFTEVLMPAGALTDPAKSPLTTADVGYLPGDEPVKYVINDSLSAGPRVLIIGDAANEPVVAYLSAACKLVMLVDPAAYKGDIMHIATELNFNAVYISLSPGSIDDEHFPWLRSVRMGTG